MGDFAIGWIIGWALVMEYAISAAAIARSFGSYFVNVFETFGITLPYWVNAIPLGETQLSILFRSGSAIVQ